MTRYFYHSTIIFILLSFSLAIAQEINVIHPSKAKAGETLQLTITGNNTNWINTPYSNIQVVTSPYSNMSFNNIQIVSPEEIKLNCTVNSSALAGKYDITLKYYINGNLSYTISKLNFFQIYNSNSAIIKSITPSTVNPGKSYTFKITGQNTNWVVSPYSNNAIISFADADIQVSNIKVTNSVTIESEILISPNIKLGRKEVSLQYFNNNQLQHTLYNTDLIVKSDSCFNIDYNSYWNLISVPVQLSSMNPNDIYQYKDGELFSFNSGYQIEDSLKLGSGYWLKFSQPENVSFCGASSFESITLNEGWNLIGAPDYEVIVDNITTNPSNILTTYFFNFNNGYSIAQVLEPGKGYWIKSNSSGTLYLNSSGTSQNQINAGNRLVNQYQYYREESLNKIIITDSKHRKTELIYDENVTDGFYFLPPTPPNGVYDVRYEDDTFAGFGNKRVLFNSPAFPITITSLGANIKLKIPGEIDEGIILNDGNKFILRNDRITSIEIENVALPTEFELMQNYPNPFNPTTVIKYSIPALIASDGGAKQSIGVTLKVYDILGSEVATLVNEQQEAGYHEVRFDAKHLTSGIYVYRITADKFSDVKKMLLIK